MFAYCENNPVNFYDSSGCNAVTIFWGWVSGGWAPALAEPTPFGEIVYVAGAVVLGVVAIAEVAFVAGTLTDLIDDANEKPESDERPTDENGDIIVQPREQPKAEDGYIPPKKGPKWNNEKKGWEDKNGNVWVPAPTGTRLGHGGGHWDVQSPGGGYTNIYPGGKMRGGGKPPLPKIPISTK